MIDVNSLFTNNAPSNNTDSNTEVYSIVSAVESISRLYGKSTFVIDFDEHKLIYRSERMLYLDEAAKEDIQRECSNPYWSLVSEDTLGVLVSIHDCYASVYNLLSMGEFARHISVIDYPIIIRKHQLFITQKFTPLQLRPDGITKVGMFTISPSNKNEIGSEIITHNGRRFRLEFKDMEYIETNLNVELTFVEKTILHRVKMGMTTKEIADKLFLSINTIKTHKQQIFRKLHVNTMAEVMTVVENYHLI